MTWVKVCGLRRREEIEVAASAGADAIGFVSIPGSPRFLSLEEIAPLITMVPSALRRIILTMDLDPDELINVATRVGADGVQPYGRYAREAAEAAMNAGLFVLLPLRADEADQGLQDGSGLMPLYDSRVSGVFGGSGQTFDWGLLEGIEESYVVAGGLSPENVDVLVNRLQPWGVDASSRLETHPGTKDLGKISAFVSKAKGA